MRPLVCSLLALFCLCTPLVAADEAAEKRKEIDRLLEVTGMTKLMDQMLTQMLETMRAQSPELGAELFESFRKRAKTSELIQLIMPIYEKYYSVEDLKAITAFHESPAGRKVLQTMPQVMQEVMAVSEKWGEKLASEAIEEAAAAKKPK